METSTNDYTIYILSNGRPDNVETVKQLKKLNYSGSWMIVVDDEDPTRHEYIKRFGDDKVLIFSKSSVMSTIDMGDNFGLSGSVVPRAAIWEFAKKRGDRYFIMLDDDYNSFRWRFDDERKHANVAVKNIEPIFTAMVDYFASMPKQVLVLAMLQGGDFIGGKDSPYAKAIWAKRKAMNVMVCATNRPFTFPGRLNEDVNAYTEIQRRGFVFMSINQVYFGQPQTQKVPGGLTETYRKYGTYVKSFYTVMRCPSGVKIHVLQANHKSEARIHHRVSYNNVAPKIVPQRFRKESK